MNKEDLLSALRAAADQVAPKGESVHHTFSHYNPTFTVRNDDEFHAAMFFARRGDLIHIAGDVVIDLSDILRPGKLESLVQENRIPFDFVIPEGVVVYGDRGIGGCKGAILKCPSYIQSILTLSTDARLTGLSIQGPDGPGAFCGTQEQQSSGIRIIGDDAGVDNCEIAGFGNVAIMVENCPSAYVTDCYIHDISGIDCGYGLKAENSQVRYIRNTFYRVNHPVFSSEGIHEEENKIFEPTFDPEGNKILDSLPLERLEILSGCYYNDRDDKAYCMLYDLLEKASDMPLQELKAAVSDVIDEIGNYVNYYRFKNSTGIHVTVDGVRYGAKDDENPIGGGMHYSRIITEGNVTVTTALELKAAIENAKEGDIIYIPDDVIIDLSNPQDESRIEIDVNTPVTIASNRGFIRPDGTVCVGGIIRSNLPYVSSVIRFNAPGIRMTGLIFKGPDPARHLRLWDRCFRGKCSGRGGQPGHKFLNKAAPSHGLDIRADDCEVDNCELCGWTSAAVGIGAPRNKPPIRNIRLHHNFVHHNQINALGYGFCHGRAYTNIYCNLFNYNRHSIAGGGQPESGYVAHDNVEMGESIGHYFDMHGGGDRRDGTNIAGDRIEMFHNSFLGTWLPYVVRGEPVDIQIFEHNIHYRNATDFNPTRLTGERFYIGKNIWNYNSGIIEVKEGFPDA